MEEVAQKPELTFQPLTRRRWADFLMLFGEHGAYGGCWCMWWRISRSEFNRNQGEGNQKAMKEIVDSGVIPGILAYDDIYPVGWCSIAPREQFASLNRSPVLKPVDDRDVWSIVCFFIDKKHRGKDLTLELIQGAVEYASSQGAEIIEAYPTVSRGGRMPPVSSFMGMPHLFEKAGFEEVARPSRSKMIMRFYV
jgi:GNAT superfamily N-acetyltransferase